MKSAYNLTFKVTLPFNKTPVAIFIDMKYHWAKDDIDFVVSRGVLFGISATAFSPNTDITRGDFITAIGKLSVIDVSGYTQTSFTDVNNTDPAMPDIEWTVTKKIVQGIGLDKFGRNLPISRQEMAVMMQRYAKTTGYIFPISRITVTFSDESIIAAYAMKAVRTMQQAGIMTGIDGNLFNPKDNTTRAESCAIIRHFVELTLDESSARGWSQNESGQWFYFDVFGKARIS